NAGRPASMSGTVARDVWRTGPEVSRETSLHLLPGTAGAFRRRRGVWRRRRVPERERRPRLLGVEGHVDVDDGVGARVDVDAELLARRAADGDRIARDLHVPRAHDRARRIVMLEIELALRRAL